MAESKNQTNSCKQMDASQEAQWINRIWKVLSARLFIFLIIPALVMFAYIDIFGKGELMVHGMAIGQYTLMTLIAYAIAGSLTNNIASSDLYRKITSNESSQDKLALSIIYATLIGARIACFLTICISYTMFMTLSRSMGG